MPGRREPAHVHPDLGDEHACRGDTDARCLHQLCHRLSERGDLLTDLGVELGDVGARQLQIQFRSGWLPCNTRVMRSDAGSIVTVSLLGARHLPASWGANSFMTSSESRHSRSKLRTARLASLASTNCSPMGSMWTVARNITSRCMSCESSDTGRPVNRSGARSSAGSAYTCVSGSQIIRSGHGDRASRRPRTASIASTERWPASAVPGRAPGGSAARCGGFSNACQPMNTAETAVAAALTPVSTSTVVTTASYGGGAQARRQPGSR